MIDLLLVQLLFQLDQAIYCELIHNVFRVYKIQIKTRTGTLWLSHQLHISRICSHTVVQLLVFFSPHKILWLLFLCPPALPVFIPNSFSSSPSLSLSVSQAC
ncbi:hypothetical protein ILYODFUR_027453 [Ilyodon furcidens]|uniref:Secreted protein n=1 Tax=Ilyodon furcidens TaxID=33524 RepID=A0ABV0TP27_9TELE